jgi:hypothetical protein
VAAAAGMSGANRSVSRSGWLCYKTALLSGLGALDTSRTSPRLDSPGQGRPAKFFQPITPLRAAGMGSPLGRDVRRRLRADVPMAFLAKSS